MEEWKTVKVAYGRLESTLNDLVRQGWHIWPQQIHIIQPTSCHGIQAVVICSKEERSTEDLEPR